MPTLLKNLVITKVALVDEGSCSAAHIKLYKRKQEGGSESMTFEEFLKSLPEDQRTIVEAEIEKAKGELPEGAMSAEEKLVAEQKLADAETAKADVEKAKTLAEEQLAELQKAKEGEEEDILKNVDPAVRQMIEKARNQAAAAEQAIKKMRDDQETAEALAKAKELPNIGAPAEDLAKSLKVLKGLDAELFNSLYGVLKAANEMISAKENLTEVGKSAGDADSNAEADTAWTEIEKKAEEIVKSTGGTIEAAIAKAVRENPELYSKYLATQK